MNILDLPIGSAFVELYFYDSWEYLADCIEDYDDYLSPELKAIEDWDDRTEAFVKFLDEHIKLIDTITDYYDLEDGYEDNVLILDVDGEIIGVPFSYSNYNGIECNASKLGDCPRYHAVQKTTYEKDTI
jgi:hypothetical protein